MQKTNGHGDVLAALHLHPLLSIFPPCPGRVRAVTGGSHNSSHPLESQPGVGVCGVRPCGAGGSLEGRKQSQKEPRLFPSREGWILGDVALLCVELKLLLEEPGGCRRFSLGGTRSELEQRPPRSS